MKKLMMLTAAVTLLAIPAFSAVQYDFVQRTSHEGVEVPTTELVGRAILEGTRSRIEFTGGDVYPAGTYMVSIDGSRRLYFVDPEKKWYTEVNTAGIATAVAASNIQIANLKSNLEKVSDGEIIAGHPTAHYKLTITYDITVPYRTMALKQSVRTIIHTWATTKFGDIGQSAFANTVRTGNVEVDRLVETETTKVAGLPLRQSVTITMTNATGRPVKSNLPLPPTRTIVRETQVTRIGEVIPSTMTFKVPSTYRRADVPDVPPPPMEVLDMKPPAE
jgi:hypothetical protein